ncbi:TPA: cytochrome o ubiquinol oxidase subunit III [Vibrio vulnificus]|uniref:cytochrome o ubiquinol oxidase subunit III n=1 Tax=Vibrio sp. 05-20-BW147 TaxID=2575834 RepID=UPI001592BCC5|nr:cytochrome o ubiquinol oxidase subunit III [Vibrio sp. 05-20-BW147]NVC64946.1 cytochrome o ubiquinol oxidase subunit III [Vibrio sp. 05-20-BW147]HAS6348473.1 cytochrome o ubiquinol oxidase subunit III [Vibrio vulnificus]
MNTNTHIHDHHDDHDHHDTAGDDIFGFWVYILSDCLLFGTLFAVFAVYSNSFAGIIEPSELFNLWFVAGGTALLLLSSFTFGMAMLKEHNKDMKGMFKWLWITFALGLGFLLMELYEFYHFSQAGATFDSSAYWSSFYALVATHGLHVFAGLIWMLLLFVHFKRDGFTTANKTRLALLSLFWHFLDIIWICVFSVVYLMGVM